jgi:hypothetical protein
MSFRNLIEDHCKRLVIASDGLAPDDWRPTEEFSHWLSGKVLLDARQTTEALTLLKTDSHTVLVRKIYETYCNPADKYFKFRDMSPALGINGGEYVIYLLRHDSTPYISPHQYESTPD